MIKSADIRHTLHGSPQTTTKYGKSAPIFGAVPILVVALLLVVVIVKLSSNMSWNELSQSNCKNTKKRDNPFNIGRLFGCFL